MARKQRARHTQRRGQRLTQSVGIDPAKLRGAWPGLPRMSDLLVDFAQPVLDVLPEDADLRDFQRALDFAAAMWNACVALQHSDQDLRAEAQASLDRLLGVLGSSEPPPPEARALLLSLLERKRDHFANERRIIAAVDTEVRGDRIHVTALSTFV